MKDKITIYIRVDANEQIATGHLMRTLSIAEEIRTLGGECCFITSDYKCDDKIKKSGFEVVCLESAWNDLNSEIESMIYLIQNRNIRCLLIDSYFVTREYLETLSKLTKIVYIDDIKAFEYPCHAIINYVIGENKKDYFYFQGELYLGTSYVPLRKEFTEVPVRPVSKHMKQIMVTTGGTDMYHFGMYFVRAFLEDDRFRDCHLTLIVGSKNMDKDIILSGYENEKRVKVFVDADNMSRLMQEADCIISAGGTTLYEACACKTPTISYALADNQLTNVERFDKLGQLYYAGDIRNDIDMVINRILDRLQLMKAIEVRKRIAESMAKVVDGKGALRIAQILMNAGWRKNEESGRSLADD